MITDVAPAHLRLNAVTGPGCTLTDALLTCTLDTLAPGASTTILLQATANTTTAVTNTAIVTAVNDTDLRNNIAAVTIAPVAAAPRNACVAPIPTDSPPLVLNEVLYNEVGSSGDEWVELYTTTNLPAGTVFFLSDNESSSGGFNRLVTIPASGVPAGVYIVVHDDSNPLGDDLDATDGLMELWGAGGNPTATSLRNTTGDNLTLYRGSAAIDANAIDYMRYDNDATTDATTDPAPSTVVWSGFAADNAGDGQSLALLRNGIDGNTGADWVLSGASGTIGKATPGADNNGLIQCNVAIAKSGPPTGAVGVSFAYTIAVYNTAPITMTGVVVTDTQPTGLIFTAVTGAGCNLSAGSLACAIGTLSPLHSAVITVTAMANRAGTITNTAYTSVISDSIVADNQASHAMNVQALGSIGDFVYLDRNRNGTQDVDEQQSINDVFVTLHDSAGLVTTTVTVDGFYLFPQLPAGAYTITVGSIPGYEHTDTAFYTVNLAAGQIDAAADFGLAYARANVHVTKGGPATATVGDVITYTLLVQNLSATTPAFDVVLTDTIPSGLTPVGFSDHRCGLHENQLLCNLGVISPQTTVMITMPATAAVPGDWVNAVTVAANNDDEVADNNASLTTTILVLTPTPTATSRATAAATATVTTTSTTTPMPTNPPSPTVMATATPTQPPPTLPPPPTATTTPSVTATVTPLPTITPVTTLPLADLVLVKSAPFTSVEPGGVITYTLAYSNVGSVAAVHVTITETVPAHTTFLPTHSTFGWVCPDGTQAGNTCHFRIPQIAPHQGGRLRYVVQVDRTMQSFSTLSMSAYVLK